MVVILDRRYPKVNHEVFKRTLKRHVSLKAIVDSAIASLQWGPEGLVHPIFDA